MLSEQSARRLSTLARALYAAAVIVLALCVVMAAAIATTQSSLPGFEDVERSGRSALAIGLVAGGFAGAGILAGLGGILRVLLASTPRPGDPGGSATPPSERSDAGGDGQAGVNRTGSASSP